MLELFLLVAVTLVVSPLLLGALALAYRSPRFAGARILPGPGMQVPWPARMRSMSVTSAISLAMVLAATWLFFGTVVVDGPSPAWLVVTQAVAILLVYDFLYYAGHRAMHHPTLLRHVHGIHHRARNPSALESLYQHPLELVIGLVLLFGSTVLVSLVWPVHVRSYALMFFVYSMMNILVHSGMDTKRWWLRPIDFLTRKHHVHHHDDPTKNYSTLTPLPDLIFGTAA